MRHERGIADSDITTTMAPERADALRIAAGRAFLRKAGLSSDAYLSDETCFRFVNVVRRLELDPDNVRVNAGMFAVTPGIISEHSHAIFWWDGPPLVGPRVYLALWVERLETS